MMIRLLLSAAFIAVMLGAGSASAREIHVAKTGNDSGSGNRTSPYRTIGKAAEVAQPGDTVTVRAGTYREWVKPARGGTGEEKRITYRAAPGEQVIIKGSERITSWTREGGGVWKAELPNAFFGEYNPYALKLTGGWLNYGQWHHRGDVYLNGEAYYEKETAEEIEMAGQSWHCQVGEETTTIRANFGEADPNAELAEINVREMLFMPEVTGLKYITVDGLHFMHAAANWAPPTLELQTGAVGPRMGKHWIIENCTIVNARCVGIILGHAPGVDYTDIDAFGDHIIRNNVIRRCGQAGIAGQKGATRSLIAGNFIEDTNYRKEFGGWETAAIKFHNSVDTVIRGNLIRGVYHQKQGAYGIWMDYANQGTRITGNIIYDTQAENIFLEMNHGPTLVDNNVLIGGGLWGDSENNVFAHNLFVDCGYPHRTDLTRRSQYYTPHTTLVVGRKPGVPRNEKWYNNIYIRQGLDEVKEAPGYVADYNVFLEGAKKSPFGDENSAVDSFVTDFHREDHPLGVTIEFTVNDTPLRLKGPWVDGDLVGVFPTAEQTIEDRYGKPIRVDTDMNGRKRTRPIAGPLADLKPGRNTIVWSVKNAGGSKGIPRGRNADASWRKQARARIEKVRKAPLKVEVVDARGKPIAGATVHVQMRRHAFGFGNILNPSAFQLEGENGRMYREIFAKHFNKTTFESGFRWHNWYMPAREGRLEEHTKLLDEMIRFCQSHEIDIRGHYLSWAPLGRPQYKPTDYRTHPDKLWPELSAHIDEMLAFTNGRLAEWDAINHIIGWDDTLATVAGSDEIYAKIIRHARSKTDTPLWVNEGQILPGGGRAEAYENVIRYLAEKDAAPDGIGFMAHFKENSLRPIDELWETYNRFATFGVPLQLTEFDIDTRNEQLQADYLRDVMTITFSHPSFNAIVMWGFWEGRHWRPNAALWRRDWSIKPAGTTWIELVFKTWWTDEKCTTDASGLCSVSAFLGDYDIVVEHAGRTVTTKATVGKSGHTATVRFERQWG